MSLFDYDNTRAAQVEVLAPSAPGPLVYAGVRIKARDEMLSLTDMWKAAGQPESRDPKYWLRQDTAIAFIDAIIMAQNVTVDHLLAADMRTSARAKAASAFTRSDRRPAATSEPQASRSGPFR